MKSVNIRVVLAVLFLFILSGCVDQAQHRSMLNNNGKTIATRVLLPLGYKRVEYAKNSFSEYLRNLPLKPAGSPVRYYTGDLKPNQDNHLAVIDMPLGREDLQQCADSLIKLKAEFFWTNRMFDKLVFKFTSGDESHWNRWKEGFRPNVKGNKVIWAKITTPNGSRANFMKWLNNVYLYAGTISIARDYPAMSNINEIIPGDFFVNAGSPGHAVLISDVAVNNKNGKKIFLLIQGFMPAQDIHLLKNPGDPQISPWYSSEFEGILRTPNWDFQTRHLRRFK